MMSRGAARTADDLRRVARSGHLGDSFHMETGARGANGAELPLKVDALRLPGGRAVLRPIGELDLATCERLREAIDALLNGGHDRLVVDMSALRFLDSSGMSVLAEYSMKAERQGGQLVLAAVRPQPAKVLRICGLDRKLPVYPEPGDAIAALPLAGGADPAGGASPAGGGSPARGASPA